MKQAATDSPPGVQERSLVEAGCWRGVMAKLQGNDVLIALRSSRPGRELSGLTSESTEHE